MSRWRLKPTNMEHKCLGISYDCNLGCNFCYSKKWLANASLLRAKRMAKFSMMFAMTRFSKNLLWITKSDSLICILLGLWPRSVASRLPVVPWTLNRNFVGFLLKVFYQYSTIKLILFCSWQEFTIFIHLRSESLSGLKVHAFSHQKWEMLEVVAANVFEHALN